MKKSLFFIFLTLLCVSMFYQPNVFAQDSPQWHLPEGVKTRFGKGIIYGIKYLPDGARFEVWSSSGTWFYDAVTYEELIHLSVEDTYPASKEWLSPNGQVRVVHRAGYGSTAFYDVNTGTLLNQITHKFTPANTYSSGRCTSVSSRSIYSYGTAFSLDGQLFAVGGSESTAFYDVNTSKFLHSLPIPGPIREFSPDGQILLSQSLSDSGYIHFWNVDTGTLLYTLRGYSGQAKKFSPGGHLVLFDTSSIRFYDVDTGTLLYTLRGTEDIAFSPDGQTFASTAGSAIYIWDTNTGRRLRTLIGSDQRTEDGRRYVFPVRHVTFSPDGKTLAIVGYDGPIRFFDVETFRRLHTITGYEGDGTNSVAFSPDGQTLARAVGVNLTLWDTNTGEHIRRLLGHTNTISSVAFSPDGQTLASGDYANTSTVRLWNIDTGKNFRVLKVNTKWVIGIAFSPDGQMLASASGIDGDGYIIELWDIDTGRLLRTLTEHTNPISSVAFSPDGKTLASGSWDSSVRLWDVDTGMLLHTLYIENSWEAVESVAFSPDGQTLASGDDDGIHLWDVDTGTLRRTMPIGSTKSVAFSPDGQTLASGVRNRRGTFLDIGIRLWDVDTGRLLSKFEGSPDNIAFSPDGQTLTDGTFLWDIASIPPVPEYYPEDVNQDGVVNIWDLVQVSRDFGESCFNNGIGTENDVNGDGIVNILDLILVAEALGNTASAPDILSLKLDTMPTRAEVEAWLHEARQINFTDPAFQRGILVLEQLLGALTPKETVLLPNYPNPFNPETWIPYDLAKDAEVTLHIYAVNGTLVRTLALGQQQAGLYQSRSRAAYWDGKNEVGEPVASGIYFYTLTAEKYTATRKMLIKK